MARVKSEYEVEDLLIDRLEQIGYEYVEIYDYDALVNNFREQFCRFNSKALNEAKGKAELSDREFKRIMIRLDGHTVYESAQILRDKWVLDLDNGKQIYVEFLTNDVTRNIYQVTHQVSMKKDAEKGVTKNNRYDVTILINGLPVTQIELKRPGIEINEAINQINRYRKDSFKGLFRYIQIFIVSNSAQTKYFANANEMKPDGNRNNILKSLVFFWTDAENERINKLIPFAEDFLDKFRHTEMLTKFFVIKESEPVLMVMRPYQVYAVKRCYDRVIASHMNAYVFHCTGSGKTLSSFKLATLLRDNAAIDKVIFLVDRKDLDDQTVEEYNSFEDGCVDNTDNTKTLIKALQDTTKPMIITTIQKMAVALKKSQYESVMEPYKTKRVAFIIDECHRTQFGKMHGMIKKHFANADYIGFTGTPIFAENAGASGLTTADIFKNGDGTKVNSCIHRYMIKEAIADGNVLRFSVEYMRNMNVVKLPDAVMFDMNRLDDPLYWKELGRNIDEYYHLPNRMEAISKDILEHLEQHTRPQGKDVYTAMFATDSIPSMLEYYDLLKANNHKGYRIAAICNCQVNEDMEEGANETCRDRFEKCIEDYNAEFGTSFSLETFDAYRKDIIKRMKQKDTPQIDLLLVVDMMLTGFDSKPTNLLILDKNLEWHGLLQAYSRTNRVDKVTKQFGQIVTYRNIKQAQDDALRLFSGDGNPDGFLMKPYEFYLAEFGKAVEALRKVVPAADDAGHLQNEKIIRMFVLAFRDVASIYATLKTFSKFDQADCDVFLDEEEFYDYKSWYLYFYDQTKGGNGGEGNGNGGGDKPNPDGDLGDIDFNIELVRTDKINVIYILNLLRDIDRNDKDVMAQAVDLVLREIERSDNEKLRYKKEIMKAFITERLGVIGPDDDIIKAYDDYEKELLDKEIKTFAKDNKVDEVLVRDTVVKYFANDKSVNEENLRQNFSGLKLGLLRMTMLIDDIMLFVKDMYNKFTAEGD